MKKIFFFAIAFFPLACFAYSSDVDDLLFYIMTLLKVASGLLTSAAFLFFFWTLIQFIYKSREGKEDLAKNKTTLIYSGIALFMMFGIWSVVGYVQSSLGVDLRRVDTTETPALPMYIKNI